MEKFCYLEPQGPGRFRKCVIQANRCIEHDFEVLTIATVMSTLLHKIESRPQSRSRCQDATEKAKNGAADWKDTE